MHRLFTKIFVACLFILGDAAIASENNYYSDNKSDTESYSIELSKLAQPDENSSNSHPHGVVDNRKSTQTPTAFRLAVITGNRLISDLQVYPAFHSRAPPTPAN